VELGNELEGGLMLKGKSTKLHLVNAFGDGLFATNMLMKCNHLDSPYEPNLCDSG
jgi:hypothetical protein